MALMLNGSCKKYSVLCYRKSFTHTHTHTDTFSRAAKISGFEALAKIAHNPPKTSFLGSVLHTSVKRRFPEALRAKNLANRPPGW